MPLKLSDEVEYSRFSVGRRGTLDGRDIFAKAPLNNEESTEQFANELLLLKETQDIEGILHPIDYIDGYLIFPYVEHDLLTSPIDLDIRSQVLIPLLKVLSALEERKIAHRDLKKENIRITDAGTLYVSDLGRATTYKMHCPNRLGSISQHHAPDTTVSGLSDLYSVGVLIYQMLIGPHYMRDFVYRGRPPELLNKLSPDLKDFVLRATDPSPLRRYQTASEALQTFTPSNDPIDIRLEKYDIVSSFEVYLEILKKTFEASHQPSSAFDKFIGDHGTKYYMRLENWLTRSDTFLSHLKIGSRIIGLIEASVNKRGQAQISTLFLQENFRGQGLAARLEMAALEFFRSKGFDTVILNVSKANSRAITYYRKANWRQMDESAYPDSLQFSKSLKEP